MKRINLPLPELEFIAITRFMLGVGATHLLGHLLPPRLRNIAAWLLLAFGGLSTPALVYDVYKHRIQP